MSTATGNFPLQCSSRRRRAPPPHGEVVAVHHADAVEVQSTLHSTAEEPQSPVTQENFPAESVEHRVRPHRRPDQAVGTATALDWPGCRAKPVVASCAVPAPDKIPGQTG